MSRIAKLLAAVLLVPSVAMAQGAPAAEIGTSLGVTIMKGDGSTQTHFGVPGQGIAGQPTLYATFFAGKAMMIEPQVAFNIISSQGESMTTLGLGGQLGYLFKGAAEKSGYVAANVALQSVEFGGNSESEVGAGVKLGYRIPAGSGLGVRFEAGYRRWFDSKANEITFGIGIGGVVHRKK